MRRYLEADQVGIRPPRGALAGQNAAQVLDDFVGLVDSHFFHSAVFVSSFPSILTEATGIDPLFFAGTVYRRLREEPLPANLVESLPPA
jgi:hypothetical protein